MKNCHHSILIDNLLCKKIQDGSIKLQTVKKHLINYKKWNKILKCKKKSLKKDKYQNKTTLNKILKKLILWFKILFLKIKQEFLS